MEPTVEVGFIKPSSRCMCVRLRGPDSVVHHDLLVSGQPTGRLLNFLLGSFASGVEAEDAFRNGGGSLVTRTRAGKPPRSIKWSADSVGYPVLELVGGSVDTVVEVKMLVEEATWL